MRAIYNLYRLYRRAGVGPVRAVKMAARAWNNGF